jgi:hypothetical protein
MYRFAIAASEALDDPVSEEQRLRRQEIERDARHMAVDAFKRFAQAYGGARKERAPVRVPRMYLEAVPSITAQGRAWP